MHKEDLRVIRTKKMLTNALKELLQEKSFDKISVGDLCERALVHRATFYNHFNDKTDLLNYIFDEIQEEIYKESLFFDSFSSAKDLYMNIIDKILEYCVQNKESLKLILKNSTNEFQTILLENIKYGITYLISKNKDFIQSETYFDAIESFFTGGLSALCVEIILTNKNFDKQSILNYIEKVMDATLNFCN